MFNIFEKYKTITAEQMNENFTFTASEDLFPRSGVSLSLSSLETFDLGNSDFRWNNVYCNNLDFSSMTNSWVLVSQYSLDSATGSIEITGLDGDTDEVYRIFIYTYHASLYGGNHAYIVSFNGVSSGAYGYQEVVVNGGTATPAATTASNHFIMLRTETLTSCVTFSEMVLYAKTGAERLYFSNSLNQADTSSAFSISEKFGTFSDATTTITSIKISTGPDSFDTGTTVLIYAKR